MAEASDLPRCRKCGATVPLGKMLCWCCEHGPKLHVDSTKDENCDDTCEIHFGEGDKE